MVTFATDDRDFVCAIALRIVRDPTDAEDVAQEAMLLAYRYRASFRGDSSYRSWLYRIATTTALGFLRRRKRARLESIDRAGDLVDPAPSSEGLLASAEIGELVHRALDELAPLYREVLLARFDATATEVATELGISVANVKIRTHRAWKQLREKVAA